MVQMLENKVDRKSITANPNPNSNPNPKAQECFRTDEMTSLFEQVHRIPAQIALCHYHRNLSITKKVMLKMDYF